MKSLTRVLVTFAIAVTGVLGVVSTAEAASHARWITGTGCYMRSHSPYASGGRIYAKTELVCSTFKSRVYVQSNIYRSSGAYVASNPETSSYNTSYVMRAAVSTWCTPGWHYNYSRVAVNGGLIWTLDSPYQYISSCW